ncbi:Response regulator of citrate/malate metabolism [Paramicrobacterium humi]|uniref:Transcriptional regulatory protein n=1 Tax=Paramicrobacterium humi TaxID=640635 RepID=A0A1H4IWL4_9MICO|nr:response regulator [Microbacterium humi]SEB38367.1 Response regulator of citrate/malate metabolism [Microbacterium humi]
MSGERDLRVLVVDDEPLTAQAHADYVQRVQGFVVAGIAPTGAAALDLLKKAAEREEPIDLILLDMTLTDLHGLDVARRIRRRGYTVDIMAITAVRDLDVVRNAISAGVTQYLIKPFTFAVFREKLENHRGFRLGLTETGPLATQASIDSALGALRTVSPGRLPKGLLDETLAAVSAELRAAGTALSATEVGARLDLSRVTVRRYLEYLAQQKQAVKAPRHGTPGRPEYEYRWV